MHNKMCYKHKHSKHNTLNFNQSYKQDNRIKTKVSNRIQPKVDKRTKIILKEVFHRLKIDKFPTLKQNYYS